MKNGIVWELRVTDWAKRGVWEVVREPGESVCEEYNSC